MDSKYSFGNNLSTKMFDACQGFGGASIDPQVAKDACTIKRY